MGQMIQDSGWRIPDALWEQMVVLLPPRPRHPLGCHNPRVPDRAAMDGIFFVLRPGCQWGALSATGICSKSSAHRRFTEEAGVFHEFWQQGLLSYDGLVGIDWEWLSADGAMAPLGGEKNRPQPDRGKLGTKRSVVPAGSPSASPWQAPTCPTTSCWRRRSTPCQSSARRRSSTGH